MSRRGKICLVFYLGAARISLLTTQPISGRIDSTAVYRRWYAGPSKEVLKHAYSVRNVDITVIVGVRSVLTGHFSGTKHESE
jgi:hypothetical protein